MDILLFELFDDYRKIICHYLESLFDAYLQLFDWLFDAQIIQIMQVLFDDYSRYLNNHLCRHCCRLYPLISRRLKLVHPLFAAWLWRLSKPPNPVRCLASSAQQVHPQPNRPRLRTRSLRHRQSSTALSIGWRSTSGRTGHCLGTKRSGSGSAMCRQHTRPTVLQLCRLWTLSPH